MLIYPIKNANRTMNLMTKTVAKTLPPIGGQENKGKDAIAYVKFFLGGWTWYITEMNPDTGEMFGMVQSPTCPDGELGYSSLSEMSKVLAPPGIAIERDKWWTPTPLKDCLGR